MPPEDFMRGTTSSITETFTTTGPTYSSQIAGTSAGTAPYPTGSGAVSYDEYSAMSAKKASSMKSSEKARPRRKVAIRVFNSPKGQRVKLVGANLVELAPIFVRWADRLGKDLRVVNTDGEAAYQFYKRPMVAQRLSVNGLCLFLTGSMNSEIKDDGTKWRVGLDELLSLKAPPKLDSPEFPSFGNIADDRKSFIGRVEGKFIYTMLYVPQRRVEKPDATLPGGIEMKDVHTYEFNPTALEPFLEHVLSRYERIMKKYGAEIMGELTENSLREFCSDSQRKKERTLTAEIDEKTKAMRDKERDVLDLARKIREAQKDLTLLKSGALDSELGAESDRMQKLVNDGLFDKFKVRHGRLVGLTTPIVIEYAGKNYELGQFTVGIKRDGTLAIEHPTKQHPYHPHISSGGSICLGAIRNDIPKLIGMERYAMVFQVIYEFLGSYNDKDKYNKIEVCTGDEQAPANVEAGQPTVAPGQAAPRDFDEPAEGNGRTLINENGIRIPEPTPAVMPIAPQNDEINRMIRDSESNIQRAMGIPADAYRASPRGRDNDMVWRRSEVQDASRRIDPQTGITLGNNDSEEMGF